MSVLFCITKTSRDLYNLSFFILYLKKIDNYKDFNALVFPYFVSFLSINAIRGFSIEPQTSRNLTLLNIKNFSDFSH